MKIIPEHLVEKLTLVQKKPFKVMELLIGILFIRNWIESDNSNIVNFNEIDRNEVLRIYKENFTEIYEERFLKYAQYFNNISYVYHDEEAVKGYCFFFAKPIFSPNGMKKLCTVYSLAVDKRYRKQGIGEKLLRNAIYEMTLNSIDTVILYVEINNEPAIRLYRKVGFKTIGEVRDICSPGDRCYEMALDLSKDADVSSIISEPSRDWWDK